MPTGILVRRAAVAVAVAVLLMSGLGACSDPAQPAVLPTKTATTTSAPPTTSPEPLTPEQEVEQFIRDYFAEVNRAIASRDVSRLKNMSTKGCPCYGYVRVIRGLLRRGETVPDLVFTVRSTDVQELNSDDALVTVRYARSAYKVLSSDGRVVETFSSNTALLDFSLINGPEGWFIGNTIDLEA